MNKLRALFDTRTILRTDGNNRCERVGCVTIRPIIPDGIIRRRQTRFDSRDDTILKLSIGDGSVFIVYRYARVPYVLHALK